MVFLVCSGLAFQSDYAFLRESEVREWIEIQGKKTLQKYWVRCF